MNYNWQKQFDSAELPTHKILDREELMQITLVFLKDEIHNLLKITIPIAEFSRRVALMYNRILHIMMNPMP